MVAIGAVPAAGCRIAGLKAGLVALRCARFYLYRFACEAMVVVESHKKSKKPCKADCLRCSRDFALRSLLRSRGSLE